MMTFEEARTYISQVSKTGSILGLESIRALMAELSDVWQKLPIIHIAGTNGKGSVGAYLCSIFREAGLHVGRYCSPAVFDPLEVWQYDGCNMTENEYAEVMSQVRDACDIVVSKGGAYPTVFEVETAAAFVYFYREKPDVVLLETGMGGSMDATNLITHPLASVLTTISMDHMQFLGHTLEAIATVKSGIIKEGCPVFSAVQKPEAARVIRRVAEEKHAALYEVKEAAQSIADQQPGRLVFSYDGETYETAMAGSYQCENASLAILTAKTLLPVLCPAFADENAALVSILKKGITACRWPGRFEVLCKEPLVVIDGAHNEDAARQLCDTVENCFTNIPITYIIGVLADKEHEKMLKLMLPHAASVYTITPGNPRAMDGALLAEEARRYHKHVTYCKTIKEAVEQALGEKRPVLAFGSLSYLGQLKQEVQEWLIKQR